MPSSKMPKGNAVPQTQYHTSMRGLGAASRLHWMEGGGLNLPRSLSLFNYLTLTLYLLGLYPVLSHPQGFEGEGTSNLPSRPSGGIFS